jgi:drug/metabolite transporter (DMT)-like permease
VSQAATTSRAATRSAGPSASAAERRRAWILLGLLALVWGTHWSVVKIGLQDVPPLTYGALRVLLAGITMSVLLGARGKLHRPARADWTIVVSYGLIGVAGTIALMNLGLQHIPAGRASILAYTLPLWVVPIMALVRHSWPTRTEVAGLVLGMVGLVLLLQPGTIDWAAAGVLLGAVLLLGNAMCGAVSAVHTRLHTWVGTPLEVQPWQFLVALGPLAGLAVASGGTVAVTPSATLALLYSGVLATAFGYWASQSVAKTLGPLITGMGSLAVPVVGIAVGAVALGETVSPIEVAGMLVTGLGVAVVVWRGGAGRPAEPAPVPAADRRSVG